jgi:DNA-binding NarL/FixJ family response regulator
MPLMSGIEATRKIKEEFPQVKIIALSGHDRVDYIQYMKQAGASGYLAKNASAEVLVKAIDAVLLNKEYCCHETLGKLVVNYHVRMKYRDELTVREIEVMVHIAQDLEADEIAERMFISPRTVEKHRQSLFKKLGAKTIAGIALYAERNGYLV